MSYRRACGTQRGPHMVRTPVRVDWSGAGIQQWTPPGPRAPMTFTRVHASRLEVLFSHRAQLQHRVPVGQVMLSTSLVYVRSRCVHQSA